MDGLGCPACGPPPGSGPARSRHLWPDACRGVAHAPLGSDYVVATDQVADLAWLEVAPRQELQSRLGPVLFWKLHQSVGGQVAFRVVRRELAGVRCRAALGRACRGW